MTLSNNLLYLLLLYAVLDKENRISTTAGLLAALAIMLYGTCRTAVRACCGNNTNNFSNNYANNNYATNANYTNPFYTINNLI